MSKKRNEKPYHQISDEDRQKLRELLKSSIEDHIEKEELGELYDERVDPLNYFTLEDLKKLKIELKELLMDGHEGLFSRLKEIVREESDKYDEIVLLVLRYKQFQSNKTRGIITPSDAGFEFHNINNSILLLINTLEIHHLK